MKDHLISEKLIQGLDMANTIGGGMSMSKINWIENEDESILELKTPGLNQDNFSIDIKENVLHVYSHMNVNENGENKKISYIMRYFHLPYFTDFQNIVAGFEEGALRVIVPYNQMKKGFEKDIDIN